jgi:hypothetical protein
VCVTFDELKRARWARGVSRYRQPDAPFIGDPKHELLEELADGSNYTDECARQDALTAWAASEIDIRLRECAAILEADAERKVLARRISQRMSATEA